MDFGFTQQEEAFREEVRDFIRKEFPEHLVWTFGSAFTPAVQAHEGEEWEWVKKMRASVGAKGWHSLSWPEEYGGKNSYVLQNIVYEELQYFNVPGIDHIGSTFFAPTLIMFGNEEQKKKYLPGIGAGETFWCELLSEPDAGSDLASLKTTAAQDGDYWIINGQKTWTSGAHKAHMGFALVRTNQTVPKHKGLTYFIVDMATPGITIRPLNDMVGEHEFNEVFFDNVRVHKDNIVGGLNRGWNITMLTLDHERYSHAFYSAVRGYITRLVQYLKQNGNEIDPVSKEQLSQILAECDMAKLMHYRLACILQAGQSSALTAAEDKVFNCELAQRAAEVATQMLGLRGGLRRGSKYAHLNGWPAFYYLDSASFTLMGGTSEIQRNVIAGQGLGLPPA